MTSNPAPIMVRQAWWIRYCARVVKHCTLPITGSLRQIFQSTGIYCIAEAAEWQHQYPNFRYWMGFHLHALCNYCIPCKARMRQYTMLMLNVTYAIMHDCVSSDGTWRLLYKGTPRNFLPYVLESCMATFGIELIVSLPVMRRTARPEHHTVVKLINATRRYAKARAESIPMPPRMPIIAQCVRLLRKLVWDLHIIHEAWLSCTISMTFASHIAVFRIMLTCQAC